MIATLSTSMYPASKSVLFFEHADKKVQTGFSNTASALKEMFTATDLHYWQPVSRITPKQRFELLALTWQRDTTLESSPTEIASHSSYQQIIGMGQVALPFILEKMQKKPEHWFPALQAITGINPIKKEHRGNLPNMTLDWLEWGRMYGLVDHKS